MSSRRCSSAIPPPTSRTQKSLSSFTSCKSSCTRYFSSWRGESCPSSGWWRYRNQTEWRWRRTTCWCKSFGHCRGDYGYHSWALACKRKWRGPPVLNRQRWTQCSASRLTFWFLCSCLWYEKWWRQKSWSWCQARYCRLRSARRARSWKQPSSGPSLMWWWDRYLKGLALQRWYQPSFAWCEPPSNWTGFWVHSTDQEWCS